MAANARGRAELQISKKWKDREASPERTKIWTEPSKQKAAAEQQRRAVPVVYYLSRNGQLEHPHFMEVPLSSPEGLFLTDVINRLNILRGKGIASMYSWSCKRSYKNGFVWHDLAENDFIYPAHGQEYILKGSELLDAPPNPHESPSSPLLEKPPELQRSGDDCVFPAVFRQRDQSWSSSDFTEYRVYKHDSASAVSAELAGKLAAADASTQTGELRRRSRPSVRGEKSVEEKENQEIEEQTTELSRAEISPPPSDSSPETLETLMKANGKVVRRPTGGEEDARDPTARMLPSGRMRASSVLMQLITCGSISFRDCGAAAATKDHHGLASLMPGTEGEDMGQATRGGNRVGSSTKEARGFGVGVTVEDKEYFSGSLIETKKDVDKFSALRRSSSYNAERASRLELDTGIDGVRSKCIPRKPKAPLVPKQERDGDVSSACQQGGRKSVGAQN